MTAKMDREEAENLLIIERLKFDSALANAIETFGAAQRQVLEWGLEKWASDLVDRIGLGSYGGWEVRVFATSEIARRIDAVKAIREVFPVSLKEAKEFVCGEGEWNGQTKPMTRTFGQFSEADNTHKKLTPLGFHVAILTKKAEENDQT